MRRTNGYDPGSGAAARGAGSWWVRHVGLATRAVLLLLLLGLLAGCATTAKREAAPEAIFFPPLPAQPRLQFLKSYSESRDVEAAPGTLAKIVLGEKEETVEFVKPYGVAAHDGKLYLCDTRASAIHVIDPLSASYHAFGSTRMLRKPINIAFDADGNAYVADAELNQVVVFDAQERFLGMMGNADLQRPTDVAVWNDELFVCDVKNHCVYVWDRRTGALQRTMGKVGSGEGEFFNPTNIEIDAQGFLYVSDTGNFRVVKMDREGNVIRTIGGIGVSFGKFARPKGISVDREGRLYAVDSGFENIQIFDPEGRLLLFFGEPGNNAGNINMPAAVSITFELVDYFQTLAAPGFHIEYLVLVTSQYGLNKLNVYGFGRYEPAGGAGGD